jgi:DNA-binding phage protein
MRAKSNFHSVLLSCIAQEGGTEKFARANDLSYQTVQRARRPDTKPTMTLIYILVSKYKQKIIFESSE